MTMSIADARERFVATFEAGQNNGAALNGGGSWLKQLRAEAMAHFARRGFPGLRDEDWRGTDLSPLTRTEFAPAAPVEVDASALQPFVLEGFAGSLLVFVNGQFAPELSSVQDLAPGVFAGSLAQASADGRDVVQEHLGQHADARQNAFTALNTAFMGDGALIHVPRGVVVEQPIHLLFFSRGGETAAVAHPRNLIVAEDNSQVTIIEHYAGAGHDLYWTNAVTEVVAGRNSIIDHYKLQSESDAAFHIATMQVQQARDAHFSSLSVTLGGKLVRNTFNAVLGGEHVECTLNGLFLVDGNQHVDNRTLMDHAEPHCNSHELYAGILSGKAHAIFSGKIFVRQDAQKTDAKQTNRNLLLSNDAVIDTRPQLEIFADDVKCTHGATIGQLDQDAIFYLQARGIDKQTARGILTYAFASDVVNQIKVEPLRAKLDAEILERLSSADT